MKRITTILAGVVLITVATAGPEAGAGWFGKGLSADKGKRTERTVEPHRYDAFPALSFRSGELQGNSFSGWRLGENLNIVLGPQCRVTVDGEAGGRLDSGRQVVVVGSQIGDTIVALSIRMLRPEWEISGFGGENQVTWSESDPTVGEGSGPN